MYAPDAMNEIQALTGRVESLERECRAAKRWRNFLVLVVACGAALAARLPMDSPIKSKVIETQEIHVLDESGRTVAYLGPDSDNHRATSFSLYDRSRPGLLAAQLTADAGGGSFQLTGDERHGEVWMTTHDQSADINLFTRCTDASHGKPDGMTVGVAKVRGGPEGGSISLSTDEHLQVEREHGHKINQFFARSADTRIDVAPK